MRELKFKQFIHGFNGVRGRWHYFGFVNGKFIAPKKIKGECIIKQYTGLKDVRKLPIYEGDYLRITRGSNVYEDGSDKTLVVKWNDDESEFNLFTTDILDYEEEESGNVFLTKDDIKEYRMKIIGNSTTGIHTKIKIK